MNTSVKTTNKKPLSKILAMTLTCAGLGSASLLASLPALGQSQYVYAEVVETRPIYQAVTVASPREECWQEEVRVRESRRNESRTPVLVSTVIGGALGNAVGNNKSSQRVGTVVGAVLGHSVGRDIVRANSHPQTARYQTVQHCETVTRYSEEERLMGYQVKYRYNGEEFTVRADQDPGDRIRLRVSHDPVL
ncbi:MAG: glycine zipper 2TM domain-containing protein [Pseudohongiella sp.]|nr:glycine zipper 2TM domain-containing protein [Pseudohongiella sp.]MDO9521779.1 glycine zipper 2TM domain-containing protein [Pseudohongiella sp.]MDP2128391.1 glycine zipper 2TM domain-containing protein [Pseudohongiella sp.]